MPAKKTQAERRAGGYKSSSSSLSSKIGYRFKVGNQVLCRTGVDEWSCGRIVKLNYSEPDWPPGKKVPYQVQLEDRLIFVPMDDDQLCRLYTPPWWVSHVSNKPEGHFAKNPAPDALRKACSGKDVNEKDYRGNTCLLEVVQQNWQRGVSQLISLAADVNIASDEKSHPLHMAIQHGAELMQILLDAKANPNCQDNDPDFDPEFTSKTFGNRIEHRTPLHYCCLKDWVEVQESEASILIQARANLDIQDADGNTPLQLAIEEGNDRIIDLLLRSKADIDVVNVRSNMWSPLMCAAHEGKHDLVEQLILARADINKQGKQSMGPLHLAARRGDAKIVQILMTARADIAQGSECGTALDLAKKNGGVELLELLGVQDAVMNASSATSVASLNAAQRAALFLD